MAFLPARIRHLHVHKRVAVPRLQTAVHAEIEEAVAILQHRVHVVALKGLVLFILLPEHMELITVVTVDAITRRGPEVTILIEVHLGNKTAGQLFIRIEKLSCLRAHTCRQ